jgi:hypothetical protein
MRSPTGEWKGSATHLESTLHQISPYIGKIKSSMAGSLISTLSSKAETIYDPFSGSGTVSLEAWAAGKNVLSNDLNPYAFLLTQAKLYPCLSIDRAFDEINRVAKETFFLIRKVDLRIVPPWVRAFFHPTTLREVIAWTQILRSHKSHFLLACLLGILHHQRPGFLSYPSSHAVPYLREKKFPRKTFPKLYEYRPVRERLERKVIRTLKRVPLLDQKLKRSCYRKDAGSFMPDKMVDAIITSPPYMGQLDYGRDNRLRLWFLGQKDWRKLDKAGTPNETEFLHLMRSCLRGWQSLLRPKGACILVLGDSHCRSYHTSLPNAVARIATEEVGGYSLEWKHSEAIPNNRRVRRGLAGNIKETVLVLSRKER